ncbi:cobalt ECF transporter T component CbiQ [Halobacteriales archaeon QS_4_62_28]|nr:MAG: cobalt ECF transporter T component CbiQ [Halobacteriales archaeon QS_4_62_28]
MDGLDRTVAEVSGAAQSFLLAATAPERDGFLQAVDPAVKLLGVLTLLVLTVATDRLLALAGLATLPVGLAIASRLSLRTLGKRVALPLSASAVIVAPQALVQPGPAVFSLTDSLALTAPGLAYVATFLVRVGTCVALLSVLLLTTRFSALLAALRRLRVPALPTTLLAITHRSLLLFFRELERMTHARRSRTFTRLSLREAWRQTGSFLGTFLLRSLERGERVQQAARARGGTRMTPYQRSQTVGVADVGFGLVVAVTVVVRVIVG